MGCLSAKVVVFIYFNLCYFGQQGNISSKNNFRCLIGFVWLCSNFFLLSKDRETDFFINTQIVSIKLNLELIKMKKIFFRNYSVEDDVDYIEGGYFTFKSDSSIKSI